MQTAFLDMPKAVPVPPFEIDALGAFFEPSKIGEASLVSSDEKLISRLVSVLDSQLLTVLASRDAPEFVRYREEVWPKYLRAIRALSDTMSNLLPDVDLRHKAVTAVLTADFEKQRGLRFGSNLVEQALFTLWTLEKMRSFAPRIVAAGPPRDEAADVKLSQEFHLYSMWAQFHMDCLVAAMKFRRSVPDEIQEKICDGLRAVVNAYAIMKEALALRLPPQVEELFVGETLPWDEEDEMLLASSMRDLLDHSDRS
jgi:hypothetical protein